MLNIKKYFFDKFLSGNILNNFIIKIYYLNIKMFFILVIKLKKKMSRI